MVALLISRSRSRSDPYTTAGKKRTCLEVYDVVIAGVSLVQNYRSSFASEIQKGGVDGLIATLSAKNKALAQQVTKK